MNPLNAVAQESNRQLKNSITRLRSQLPLAVFTYVDVYSAIYALISQIPMQKIKVTSIFGEHVYILVHIDGNMIGIHESSGFVGPFNFCCGSYYGFYIDCGKKSVANGTVYGNPCNNPSRHISWDAKHYSQAANVKIAGRNLNGSLFDPPVSITHACHEFQACMCTIENRLACLYTRKL